MAQLELIIDRLANDLAQARLVSASNTGVKPFKPFVAGDRLSISVSVVDVSGGDVTAVDLSGYSLRVGIGALNAFPSGGTFTLSFGGDETAALAYNSSASSVASALNGLGAVTSAGGVTVSGPAGGPWVVTFDANGSRASIVVGATGLTPFSGGIVSELTPGDGSTREEQLVRLCAQPLAYTSSFSFLAGVASGMLSLNTRGIYEQLAQSTSFSSVFEVEITDGDGNVSTILQAPVTVKGDALNAATEGSPDFDTYLTALVAAATYLPKTKAVFSEPGISGLTGGGSDKLDGLATADGSYPLNACVMLSYDLAVQHWRLVAGTDAEDADHGIVRPDDYAASTNEKIWKRIG